MIPIKLAMRNFMPYRDKVPPIDFTGIHTASIWGENGSGKSALIDAITWALWGKTRAKSDDDIIHLGQTETQVEFDFTIGQQTCRIIRKHSRPKKAKGSGQSSLDLLIANPSIGKDSFQTISGNTMRETEQKIRDLLHMDYETFVNSAFLRQGHADEFTIASPGDRKKVLAGILGLSRYDELEEEARETAKGQEKAREIAESAIKDIADELAQRPACEAQLAQAQNELSDLEKVISAGETSLNALRQKKELLENKQQQLNQIEKHIAETERNLARWNSQIKQHQARIREYEAVMDRHVEIESGYSRFIAAKNVNEELSKKVTLARGLDKRKHEMEVAIERAQAAVVAEHKVAEDRISQHDAAAQKLPQLKADLQQAKAALNQLAAEEESLKKKGQNEQETLALVRSLDSEISRLNKDNSEIIEKLDLLAKQTGAICPLCERELGEEHRKLIQNKYIEERQANTAALKAKQTELLQKQAELKAASNEIPQLEARLNQTRAAAQSKVGSLERQIEEAGKAASQVNEERGILKEIEERLTGKTFAATERAALAQLENELAKLGYDGQQHEQARQQLAGLEQWESLHQKLDEADRHIKQEKELAASDEQAALELNRSLETDGQARKKLAEELTTLPQVSAEFTAMEAEHRRQTSRQNQAQMALGAIKARLERFAELELKAADKKGALEKASKEEAIYHELAQAFGKKGVQAWLIEMALPEIELETNKLLGRMTDNRMHVKIDTQRQTKTGDTAETLDIKIADELGTRNYEMYSGGEAFRINFAIRIALSKLLARRAGAPLPTLIIDEGFGTQDVTGLEKLKEAIISIQDDFKMILVITHVEEMRDAFPTRISVTKTADGSMVDVG